MCAVMLCQGSDMLPVIISFTHIQGCQLFLSLSLVFSLSLSLTSAHTHTYNKLSKHLDKDKT